MIDAGQLNRKVQLQKKVGVKDEYGQESLSWVKISDCWASIKPLTANQKLRAMASESTLTCTVAIRYSASLMPPTLADAWRIVYGERILDILSAQDMYDMHSHIIFDCRETGVTNGN